MDRREPYLLGLTVVPPSPPKWSLTRTIWLESDFIISVLN